MHPNPVYRSDDRAKAMDLVRARGFGVLTAEGKDGVMASHIPYVVGEEVLDAHLVRSNPIARALRSGPLEALLIVSGPDGYISPDWYWIEDQVPTWNYVAVHLRGRLALRDEAELREHLERLSAVNEEQLRPKKPWTLDKNTPETLEKMFRQIVPVRFEIASVEATWKLNQNKPESARHSAAQGVEGSPVGQGQTALAAYMRAVP